jgi:hypothetical protein
LLGAHDAHIQVANPDEVIAGAKAKKGLNAAEFRRFFGTLKPAFAERFSPDLRDREVINHLLLLNENLKYVETKITLQDLQQMMLNVRYGG